MKKKDNSLKSKKDFFSGSRKPKVFKSKDSFEPRENNYSKKFQKDSFSGSRKPKVFKSKDSFEPRENNYSKKFQKDTFSGSRKPKVFKSKDSFEPRENNYSKKTYSRSSESALSSKIRLNKYLANAGVSSRREADKLIETGRVSINGEVVQTLGFKISPFDKVTFDEVKLKAQPKQYILLNKPKGFITTVKDERDRKTVMDLIKDSFSNRLYPIGRLDRQTTGVLILSNDGELTEKLTHPSHKFEKIYHVKLDRKLQSHDFEKIKEGIFLKEGKLIVDKISYIEGFPKNEIGIEIHIGWNRVIRRLFKNLNYKVISLDRVSFAGLSKKGLKRGQWRFITEQEIGFLKMR